MYGARYKLCVRESVQSGRQTDREERVNSENVEVKDVVLKFFKSGHTFYEHRFIPLWCQTWKGQKRKRGNLYDFSDFVDVMTKSYSGNVDVIVVENDNVRAYPRGRSQ